MSREHPTPLETWYAARQMSMSSTVFGSVWIAMLSTGVFGDEQSHGLTLSLVVIGTALLGISSVVAAIGYHHERARCARMQQAWNGHGTGNAAR